LLEFQYDPINNSLIIQPKQINARIALARAARVAREVGGDGVAERGGAVDVRVADECRGGDGCPAGCEQFIRGGEWTTHKYALISRAAAFKNGAALVASAVSTSLPTLNARMLSYFEKTLMVLMYYRDVSRYE
jgi:hypothetical protein